MSALALTDVPRGTSEDLGTVILQLPVDQVDIGPNVRVNVEAIDELAASISEHGILQPIKVRPEGGRWIVIWGQRRLLAARQAGLERIPAIIADRADPPDKLSIEQLVENLHRADLLPLDRARAMKTVVAAGRTQADLARELGLHPSTVANDLSLLEAPAAIQKSIETGQLSPAHAKALKGLAPKTQLEVAKEAIERGYSAHRLEEVVQERKRRAEREAETVKADEERQQQNRAALEAQIAAIAAKSKPGLTTEIVAFQDYYGQGGTKITELAKLLEKAGFTQVRIASRHGDVEPRPSGGVCDCTAWKATLHSTYDHKSGGYTTKLQATPACVVAAHRQAKATSDRKAELAKYALQEAVQAHVKDSGHGWGIPNAIDHGISNRPSVIAIDRILAEAALWSLLAYRLPDWSVARGGKRNGAWTVLHALSDDELAKELAGEIARDFRDKAGYHVDWATLATELGIETPA